MQIFERVERRLNRTSRCPLLQGREHHPVDYAKLVDHPRRIRFRVIRLHEIVGAGQNIVDATPALVNDQGSVDPVARSHGAEQESLFDVLGIAAPRADAGASLLRCIIKQPAHLLAT